MQRSESAPGGGGTREACHLECRKVTEHPGLEAFLSGRPAASAEPRRKRQKLHGFCSLLGSLCGSEKVGSLLCSLLDGASKDTEYLSKLLPYVGAPHHSRLMSMHPLSEVRTAGLRLVPTTTHCFRSRRHCLHFRLTIFVRKGCQMEGVSMKEATRLQPIIAASEQQCCSLHGLRRPDDVEQMEHRQRAVTVTKSSSPPT